jgi:hypothetical protein
VLLQRRVEIEDDVAIEIERQPLERPLGQFLSGDNIVDQLIDVGGIDQIRFFAEQPQHRRPVGAMPLAGIGQRAIERDDDTRHLVRYSGRREIAQKPAHGDHRPDSMRTRRSDADFEQIEDAQEHMHLTRISRDHTLAANERQTALRREISLNRRQHNGFRDKREGQAIGPGRGGLVLWCQRCLCAPQSIRRKLI